MALEIIGAGFGRTGTLSLKLALEQLGLGPCYHMIELVGHQQQLPFWLRAIRGEAVDWDDLFADYPSTVDWPGCAFWRELADRYPEAKVLLSVRSGESWHKSVIATIYQVMTSDPEQAGPMREQVLMVRELILNGTFGGRLEDAEHAIGIYEAHNQAVRDAFGPDRLLEYPVGSGWEPLCRFFDLPVPETPFPRTNSTEDFQAQMRS